MQETQEPKQSEDLVSLIKDYISTKIELIRLSTIERLTIVVSGLITDVFVVVAMLLTFLFASLTLAFFLGEVLDSYAAGFGLVALLYLALALIVNSMKASRINPFLQDIMVKKVFEKKKKDGKNV